MKHLLAEKPTIKQRIPNFFKGAVSDYASIPELDADAKKYYKQYRKWFVECVPDASSKQVHIVSARKIKNGNGQVLNVESTDSPQPTSETLLDGISATVV